MCPRTFNQIFELSPKPPKRYIVESGQVELSEARYEAHKAVCEHFHGNPSPRSDDELLRDLFDGCGYQVYSVERSPLD